MVLLEVVIALTIFTMIAFSLVMALQSAFDAATDRNEIDVAVRGLNNQMALLHAALLSTGDQDLPDDGSGILYHLTVAVEQMQDQKNLQVQNMYRATITATWKSRGDTEQRDVSELIYQP
jgi:type II secretory pathway component PulJ